VGILKVQQDNKQKELKEREVYLDKCKAAINAKAEKDALALELGGKREILKKATELLGAVTKLKESVAAVPVISEQLTQDLRQKESDIRALEKIIEQRQMLLAVTFKAKTPYVIETDERILSEGEGSAGETLQGSAKREFRIDFKDIADVRVSSKDEALEKSIDELGKTKATVKAQLAQYQCRSLAEFLEVKESREKKEQELASKEKDLKVTLGNDTIESLTKAISELEPRLKEFDNAFKQAKGFAISEEGLAEQEREIQKLRDEVNELNGNIRENQGILKSFSKEQLEKDKKAKARVILVAETALEDLKEFQSSGEEVVKRENELQALEQKLSVLKIEQKSLERTLQEDDYGQEDVAEMEERIDALERRANRFKTRLKAYEIISEVLGEARQNILKSISGEVDQLIGSYFALITGDKYDQVRLSRDDFSLRVFSNEKGDWINPDTEELSAGARDQLYLAARLALMTAVVGDNSIPVILDDPLVHFDSERRENTRNLLKEVSKKHQLLIFSCHDYYDDWADQIITF
jgi:DNA repair exonuclease SbcCD ATPase subunit